jgi:serine/threonine protein kinase
MSPEQASGRLETLGPASDIYSLGATLYFLLTGQPPIREANAALLLARVQAGEFPPPSKVKRTVSRGLEAICRKAMALRPEDRYAGAGDLAGDISRWLADERVTAWREPLGEWVERLSRKHSRYLTALTVVFALLSPLVGFTVKGLSREYDESRLREENTRLHKEVIREMDKTLSALKAQVKSQSEVNTLKHRIQMMEEKQKLLNKVLEDNIRQLKGIPPNQPVPPPANVRD